MPSYQETLDYIFNLRGGEIDLRLHRVEQTLTLFGHPERSYPALHIAGTNGKGSTAAMLHSILSAQGCRAGLYTSPHVVSFTERIRVGYQEISQEEVVSLAEEIEARTKRASVRLTFFEFVTVIALIYFARLKVDVAGVEVGLPQTWSFPKSPSSRLSPRTTRPILAPICYPSPGRKVESLRTESR
jgi:dihydrofolate synthase/folylpolyglutamate synthase